MVCLLHFGDMPNEVCRYSTELFAKRVMPRIRPLWNEYEDHWSPKPMPRAERAVPRHCEGTRDALPADAATASQVV